MGDRIIAYAGKLLVHLIRALLVCWQRMLRLGLSVGLLSGLVALVFGAYVTQSFPPAPLTWVAALFFGFVLGYAAAMTVLADEMLLGIFEAIRVLEGDVRAGMRAAAVAAEREAGEAGRGIMRFLGHPRRAPEERAPAPASGPAPDRAPPSAPLMTVSSMERHEPGQDQTNETLAAIAATDRFLDTAPRPAINARPVRADRLPRIGWASDEGDTARAPQALVAATAAALPALAEMPPLPVRSLRSQPRDETTPAGTAAAVQGVEPAGVDAVAQPATEAEARHEPVGMPAIHEVQVAHDAETQPDGRDEADAADAARARVAAPVTVPVLTRDAGGQAPDGPIADEMPVTDGNTDSNTEPAPERPGVRATRPLETDREERGIWARIGQALIGNTTVPLREVETTGSSGESLDQLP